MRTVPKAKKKRTIKHFTCQTVARLPGQAIKHERQTYMMLATLTGNLHIGLAAIGSALGVGIIGMKAAEAVGRNPGASGKILTQAIISSALAEGIIFFAIFLAKGQ